MYSRLRCDRPYFSEGLHKLITRCNKCSSVKRNYNRRVTKQLPYLSVFFNTLEGIYIYILISMEHIIRSNSDIIKLHIAKMEIVK